MARSIIRAAWSQEVSGKKLLDAQDASKGGGLKEVTIT